MTEQEAIDYVDERYDMDVLFDIMRHVSKCPSSYTFDRTKEELDYDDIRLALIDQAMHMEDNK